MGGRPPRRFFLTDFSPGQDIHASDVLATRVPSIHVFSTRDVAHAPVGDTILVNGNGKR